MQLPASMLECLQIELSIESVAKELVHMVLQSALDQYGCNKTPEFADHQATEMQHRHLIPQRVLSISTDQDYSDSAESPLEVEDNKIDEEMEIHMQAKKIVRKVLHVACKRWDYMNRRFSIDYLVASAKKLKISDTPSPPSLDSCTVSEYETEPSSTSLSSLPVISIFVENEDDDDDDDYEEVSRRQLGKRRQRSESHDAVMLRELSMFQMERKSKSTSSLHSPSRSPIVTPRRKAKLDVNNIVSSIQRMSIAEVSEEKVVR